MNIYVVDTNFFIQAHRSHYPMDVVPSFWQKVKQLAISERIVSIDKVKFEIYRNEDGLKHWCDECLPNGFFVETSGIIGPYTRIAQWAASSTHYNGAAISEFLDADVADAWLASYGLALPGSHKIVTYEKSDPNIKRRIKIPEVCNAFGVPFTDPIGMFRELGETF